ncbi:MAG: sensor of ECF-type sigma factor [Winogradskyella sp.]|uniref:sensor of ECF-type sigma factor n=1 Tax=Winogradskyella sp. TaxID=1883156 RepID=UPI00385E2E93
MKKIVFTLLFIAITTITFAQKGERKERIKALKIALITEKLELTKDEAQKFWPIYNAHEQEMEMLRINGREKRRNMNLETITESEARKALKDFLAFEKEQQDLKADLVESLLTIIPAKKIIILKGAEEQFKRQILQELKNRRDRKGDRD